MLLQSWLGGRHPLRGRNTNSRNPRALRRRPLIERLEDRLPPGDAVLAGLLAGDLIPERVAGLNPAVPPGEARWLAEPGDGADDFTALVGVTDDAASAAVPAEKQTRLDRAERLAEDPVARPATSSRGVGSLDGRSLQDFGSLYSMAFAPLAVGTPAAVFAPHAPMNYQLDQAVAAADLPAADPEEVSDSPLDDGPQVRSAGVHALFDLGHPTTGPFPANVFTVADPTHNTGRRVNLPFPDCGVYVSDCEDLAVLNALDGFNLQPRLSVPFSGPIDVSSVTSATVFLISLGSTVAGQGYMPRGTVVGVNQVVWDVKTSTLHVESDALLAQHTRFALFVTNGIRDAGGNPVAASPEFRRFRQAAVDGPYKQELLEALHEARRLGVRERDLVTASVFTTQSATAILEKIRDQIHAATPEPADFLLGPDGERTVFALNEVTGITWYQQTRIEGPLNPVNLNLSLLDIIPGSVGQLAFGKYVSPDYMVHPGEFIPQVGTRTGTPTVQGFNEVHFNLLLPSGPRPEGGWPVAVFGHGNGGNRNFSLNVAASMAAQGIATIAINAPGHGFGPLSTQTVNQARGPTVTFSAGGRGFDQNGDQAVGGNEGFSAAPPQSVLFVTDGIRQTVADLMQLVHVIEVGMDVDGDGSRDLDASRIYYFGPSLGGNYGTVLLAVEPSVRVGATTVAGGPIIENRRLSPVTRPELGSLLAGRTPSLINPPGLTSIGGVPVGPPHFNENLPLRNQPPVINTVSGATAIQEVRDHTVWASQPGSPVAFAPHLRKEPLAGVPAKSVIYQFAKGDQSVPNPNTTAILRAGNLADRTLYYRHDLAFAEDPTIPTNPHLFLTSVGSANELVRAIAIGYQSQIAAFFASDGKWIIHPEPARFFEVPITGPLPEDLNYLP